MLSAACSVGGQGAGAPGSGVTLKSGVKFANKGIRTLNRLMAEGEKVAEEGRDAIHKATAPKRKTNPR